MTWRTKNTSLDKIKDFFNDIGHATAKFGKHLVKCVADVYGYTFEKIVYHFSEDAKELRKRKTSYEKTNGEFQNQLILNKEKFEYKYKKFKSNLIFFVTNDTVRHVAKFLLFAGGTALFIVGMFFSPVSAIAALTIFGIAVTRFIFKAVNIIKQAKNESKMHWNKLIITAKTMFKLLIAAAEIPAFFFGGPLASLITQPISGAILGIMKAYDDIKTQKRMDDQELNDYSVEELDEDESEIDDDDETETQECKKNEIDKSDDNSDRAEIELTTIIKDEKQYVQDSTNSNIQSKEDSTDSTNINYA